MFHFMGDTIVAGRLLVTVKQRSIHECTRWGDDHSIPTLRNKCLLLVIGRCGTNMLATFSRNVAPRRRNDTNAL